MSRPNSREVKSHMATEFPKDVERCIEQGAAALGKALEVLEWPNGGKDAPPHELNALLNISFYLQKSNPKFHMYAEATLGQRGRVDMIGFNGQTAIAIEAKSFGRINHKSDEVINDLKRLESFRPSLTELAGNEQAIRWWDEAESRWGIVIVSSFRGREVRDAWVAKTEGELESSMAGYAKSERPQIKEDGTASGFLALYRSVPPTHRHAARITDAVRWGSAEGWLLWAAIELPRGGG